MNISLKEKNRKKLQNLLRDLFQFDHADLNFGIYRIMNEKREEVERFIEEDLLDTVEEALSRFQVEDREELESRIDEIREQLGPNVFDESGDIKEQFQEIPLAREYKDIQKKLNQLDVAEETEAQVFNDLWLFFSRYYNEGDFLTERRYSSREAKYAVPYNGEEVYLHWANRDQYYVKTTEHFTDYSFSVGGFNVEFRLEEAEVPQDNVKGNNRYFVLHQDHDISWNDEERLLSIPFAYRPITEEEDKHYLGVYNAGKSKNDLRKKLDRSVLCEALVKKILEDLEYQELVSSLAVVPEGKSNSVLGGHLNHYTAKNTMDYFIHKDLDGFLSRELDVFLKTEVMELGDVVKDESGEVSRRVLTRMRVVREIAGDIIDFLAQIENFQKRLFEKRKFIVQTDYCLTLDKVPEELYSEILENPAQIEEWENLYSIDDWEEDHFWRGEFNEEFLENHPYIMIDTAFFDSDFKYRLLETFENLDDAINGVLVHGENFQALNLLKNKYKSQIKCVYIDPPYNTDREDFLYKDSYRHSSWISMIDDRMKATFPMLKQTGVFFSSIDENELPHLIKLMDLQFGRINFEAIAAWRRRHNQPNDPTKMIAKVAEFVLVYAKDSKKLKNTSSFYTIPLTDERQKAYSNPDDDPRGDWDSKPWKSGEGQSGTVYKITTPAGVEYEEEWLGSRETYEELLENNLIYFPRNGKGLPRKKYFLKDRMKEGQPAHNFWYHEHYGSNQEATSELTDFFKSINVDINRLHPKPVKLIKRCIRLSTGKDEYVLDFFAGSGTTGQATIKRNLEDEGARKYILIEMGDYFDTILKPRIQKVAFTNNWKNGVPQDRDGMSHMFKYHRIEAYEDALNNIKIKKPEGEQLELLREFDDYMLHYMLDFETRDSPTLLAQEKFETPFDYTLKIHRGHETPEDATVDLVETFNYLIGMKVEKVERYTRQDRIYVISRGNVRTERGFDKVVVIWRDTEALDIEKEAEWVNNEILDEIADRVYVNGFENDIRNAEPIELAFRKLMEAEVHGS